MLHLFQLCYKKTNFTLNDEEPKKYGRSQNGELLFHANALDYKQNSLSKHWNFGLTSPANIQNMISSKPRNVVKHLAVMQAENREYGYINDRGKMALADGCVAGCGKPKILNK